MKKNREKRGKEKMSYDMQNDRLKYFRLINKRIELNNLKLNPVTI